MDNVKLAVKLTAESVALIRILLSNEAYRISVELSDAQAHSASPAVIETWTKDLECAKAAIGEMWDGRWTK